MRDPYLCVAHPRPGVRARSVRQASCTVGKKPLRGWRAICLPLAGGGASFQSDVTTVRTLDGLHLAAALVTTDTSPDRAVVLVYGGGVTREEGGFFTRFGSRAW